MILLEDTTNNSDFDIRDGVLIQYIGSIGIGGDVIIPDSVTSIGDGAFSCCNNLTVTILSKNIEFGTSPFNGCKMVIAPFLEWDNKYREEKFKPFFNGFIYIFEHLDDYISPENAKNLLEIARNLFQNGLIDFSLMEKVMKWIRNFDWDKWEEEQWDLP